MFIDLSQYGWHDELASDLPPGTVPARVVRVDRGAAEVVAADGTHHARFAAQVRRAAAANPVALPCVGDWVALAWPDSRSVLECVLPRRTAFLRGGVSRGSREGLSGDGQGQVLAANVDVVFVVEPSRRPDGQTAELGRIERLGALAWECGAQPVVLLSKGDLFDPSDQELGELLAEVAATVPAVDVHAVGTLVGQGVDLVRGYLGGAKTAVVLGPSGAGKSTLVNALAGARVMDTTQVRAGDGRGRHTTVHRQLIPLPGGGLIIDTPGIRRVGLYEVNDGVDLVFADIEQLAVNCRFTDCGHQQEPDCAVLAAIESGELPERRLRSWRVLQREAAWMARRTDARLRSKQIRMWKAIHKEMRRSGRNRP